MKLFFFIAEIPAIICRVIGSVENGLIDVTLDPFFSLNYLFHNKLICFANILIYFENE